MVVVYDNEPFYAKISLPVDFNIPTSTFSATIIDESTMLSAPVAGVFREFGIGLYGIQLTLPIGNFIIRIENPTHYNGFKDVSVSVETRTAQIVSDALFGVQVIV